MKDNALDALVFDFDGVVVDSEPIHFAGFRDMLAGLGVELTRDDYYGKYLGFDDHDCFAAVMTDMGRPWSEQQIAELTAAKTQLVQRAIGESIEALPGAVKLIAAADEAGIPLAICSGALREEIVLACRCVGVLQHFTQIVSAEDVQAGKPDPQGYSLAVSRLAEATGRSLRAGQSIAIEDSPAGIESAHGAGLKVLAVMTSYPAGPLGAADLIVKSLADVKLADLEELL